MEIILPKSGVIFVINLKSLTKLDLSLWTGYGDIQPIGSWFTGDEYDGEQTKFNNFLIKCY